MRDALAPLEGQRITVHTIYRRLGARPLVWRPSWGAKTVLLSPVLAVDGTVLADHMWLNYGRAFAALELMGGTPLEIRGVVARYEHPHGGCDFHLTDVRTVRILDVDPPSMPNEYGAQMQALRWRLREIENQCHAVRASLTHVQRIAYPSGDASQGDWYATLLQVRGQAWTMHTAVTEARELVNKLDQA